MKFRANELLNGNYYTTRNTVKSIFLLSFTLLLIMLPLSLMGSSHEPTPQISSSASSFGSFNNTQRKQCNIFSGNWIHSPEGPYYTNETCHWIIDEQNCMKFGRPDSEYLHWRWKPDECELPLFNATLFLNLVRGKKMVFVGDSVGRNQMQSLLCLLSHVSDQLIPSFMLFHHENRILKFASSNFIHALYYHSIYSIAKIIVKSFVSCVYGRKSC